jgi:ERCC4-type nuclease
MNIITDSREQLPYWKNNLKALIVGDYTTTKLLNVFHIERKSLQDLYGTIVQGNARFKHELFRAAYHNIKLVMYIEGTRADFVAKNFPRGEDRKFSSDGLDKMLNTFQRKYFLEFNWHSNRKACLKAVERRLQLEEKKLK